MAKIELTEQQAFARRKLNVYNEYPSRFDFLEAHTGLKRGKLHVLLGNTGSGKSTLLRSLICDQLERKKKVFLWLSEESLEDLTTDMSFAKINYEILENLRAESEIDFDGDFVQKIKDEFLVNKPDIFVFDNITTSRFYNDHTVKEQGQFIGTIKKMCKYYDIPFIMIAHTSSTEKRRTFINEANARGSKTIGNIAEFFYTIEKQFLKEDPQKKGRRYLQFVRVIKHRGQTMDENVFVLEFDRSSKLFSGDHCVNYSEFSHLLEQVVKELV